MMNLDALLELGESVDATTSCQPLVLCHNNVDASRVENVRMVIHPPTDSKQAEDRIQEAIQEAYVVLSILCVRNDNISYGAANAAAAVHEIVTVLVKLRQES